MNLHEQYQALIRRGMPERLRLASIPVRKGHKAGLREWVLDADSRQIHPDDARDLITMHAARWWLATATADNHKRLTWFCAANRQQVCAEDRDCTSGWTEDWEWEDSARGDNILEAIIAATEHLEPAEGPKA